MFAPGFFGHGRHCGCGSVIHACIRLGILVDLTHCSADTVAAALKVSTQPMVFTHTGLDSRLGNNPSMGQMMRPRLLSKEHAKVISVGGGIVGVWTHLVDSPAEYVEAMRAMADVVGIDHVCIGTDTKLTPGGNRGGFGGPGGGRPNGKPDGGPNGAPNGFGGPGGGTNGFGGRPDSGLRGPMPGGGPGGRGPRFGERTNQVWADQKVGFYYAVVQEMLKQGFTPEEIGKVGGGNFCRAFEAATAGHA
jgi:microsomal dipeptidase-like Zn-dependent dipeptidase